MPVLSIERILSKIEFHYTPKHASWLNAAEIEINLMDIECTDWRIEDMGILVYEVAVWNKRRNDDEKKTDWGFTSENADEKLSKHYVYELNCQDNRYGSSPPGVVFCFLMLVTAGLFIRRRS